MIPCKNIAIILEHKCLWIGQACDQKQWTVGIKKSTTGNSNYTEEKLVRRLLNGRDMLEVPIFSDANAGFCRLMTQLRNRIHCRESKHYIGEYLSDTALYMFMPQRL